MNGSQKIMLSVLALTGIAVCTGTVLSWQAQAKARLAVSESSSTASAEQVAIAQGADEAYCTPELRQILRRVLTSCGLGGGGRGCQPIDAKLVAPIDGQAFNALFAPMRERGGIVLFPRGESQIDGDDATLIERTFAERHGASYFFVVARTSPDGSVDINRELSQSRAQAVLNHLHETFHDPNLNNQVGLLSLGEEYAQLSQDWCAWSLSNGGACSEQELNRSALIAWVDCQL